MASLLTLPAELRHEIWHLIEPNQNAVTYGCVSHQKTCDMKHSSNARHSLMLTCRQVHSEVSSYFYSNVHLELRHPNEVLKWIADIGSRYSSHVENLVLGTCQLTLNEEADSWANESAWALALHSMPRLVTLTVDFTYASTGRIASDHVEIESYPSSELLQRLSICAFECSTISPVTPEQATQRQSEFQPCMRSHPFTHGCFSLHEKMPPVLVQYFNTTARSGAGVPVGVKHRLAHDPMERHVLGLTPQFFPQNGLYLNQTCAFNENNENARAFLYFSRTPKPRGSPYQFLCGMMRNLPNLGYLRVGCRDLDSSFLIRVPRHLHTLDVAFTDSDADRVADNLMTMRGICRNLFTLAIDISPLHDRRPGEMDNQEEVFFDREGVSNEVAHEWAPFWQALDEIRRSKVKIWEGEGPGFRRAKDT